MTSEISAIDNYCGAGGSTTGLKNAGVKVLHAANHWQRAIETHNTNHPEVDHSCVDLHIEHPSHFPRTTIGWFSIECRVHSPAGGRKRKDRDQLHLWEQKKPLKPEDERSRMGAWDVVRFAEFHRYECVLVENVVEFATDWELFDIWLRAMHKLSYRHQIVCFNSMFAYPNPVPQSRDRIYIVFHKTGNKKPNVNFRPPGFCQPCGKEIRCIQSWKNSLKKIGKYGKRNQYTYTCPKCAGEVMPYRRPARDAIDWTKPMVKIGDRVDKGMKPLSPNTLRRIEIGLKRFVVPQLVHLGHWGEDRVYSTDFPSPTQTTKREMGIVVPPLFIHNGHWTDHRGRAYTVDDPSPTVTTWRSKSIIVPPFIDTARTHNIATQIDEPTPTLTTGRNLSVIQPPPFLAAYHGGRDAVQDVDQPSWTVATNKQMALVEPFISSYYGNGGGASVSDPSPTIRTTQGHCLIEPDWSALVEECGYRMITAAEAKILMGFPIDYVILGNQEEQFKQEGNAVTPITAEMLGRAVVESLS